MKVFYGKASLIEKTSLVCCSFILLIFIYDQIFEGIKLWPLLIVMAFIEIYLLCSCMFPEEYFFAGEELEIRNKFRKTAKIKYDSIFNMDADVNDAFLSIIQSGNVKLYYAEGTRKAVKVCRPKETAAFIDLIIQKSPEFFTEDEGNSRLKVFFKDK